MEANRFDNLIKRLATVPLHPLQGAARSGRRHRPRCHEPPPRAGGSQERKKQAGVEAHALSLFGCHGRHLPDHQESEVAGQETPQAASLCLQGRLHRRQWLSLRQRDRDLLPGWGVLPRVVLRGRHLSTRGHVHRSGRDVCGSTWWMAGPPAVPASVAQLAPFLPGPGRVRPAAIQPNPVAPAGTTSAAPPGAASGRTFARVAPRVAASWASRAV